MILGKEYARVDEEFAFIADRRLLTPAVALPPTADGFCGRLRDPVANRRAASGWSGGSIFDDQGTGHRAQGSLDLPDVGTMVGVQELPNRGVADVEAPGELDVGDVLRAHRV